MRRHSADLSKAEWILMEALWDRSRATATDIQKLVIDSQGWAYSTVKTMLDRMVEKGVVSARRVGNVYEYSPKLRRKSAVGRVVDDVFDRVLAGSVSPFISRLIENRKLRPEEVAELREMLDRYDEESDES